MEHLSTIKFAMGYEKNRSFLVIPKSPKVGKRVEKIGLGPFKLSLELFCEITSLMNYSLNWCNSLRHVICNCHLAKAKWPIIYCLGHIHTSRSMSISCLWQLSTQQNSYSISLLLGTVTILWLDSDCVASVDDCQQSGDWAANGSVVIVLPAIVNRHYTVTVQSQYRDCAL